MEAGFEVSAIEMFHMERANAEEFYEVYKGVVQEYNSMILEMTSGPCIALEVRAQNAPVAFREMSGPADPVSLTLDVYKFTTKFNHERQKAFKFEIFPFRKGHI